MIATRANHVYGLYMYIIQTTVKPFESEHFWALSFYFGFITFQMKILDSVFSCIHIGFTGSLVFLFEQESFGIAVSLSLTCLYCLVDPDSFNALCTGNVERDQWNSLCSNQVTHYYFHYLVLVLLWRKREWIN